MHADSPYRYFVSALMDTPGERPIYHLTNNQFGRFALALEEARAHLLTHSDHPMKADAKPRIAKVPADSDEPLNALVEFVWEGYRLGTYHIERKSARS